MHDDVVASSAVARRESANVVTLRLSLFEGTRLCESGYGLLGTSVADVDVVVVRPYRKGLSPERHSGGGVKFGCLLKGAAGLVVVKAQI